MGVLSCFPKGSFYGIVFCVSRADQRLWQTPGDTRPACHLCLCSICLLRPAPLDSHVFPCPLVCGPWHSLTGQVSYKCVLELHCKGPASFQSLEPLGPGVLGSHKQVPVAFVYFLRLMAFSLVPACYPQSLSSAFTPGPSSDLRPWAHSLLCLSASRSTVRFAGVFLKIF